MTDQRRRGLTASAIILTLAASPLSCNRSQNGADGKEKATKESAKAKGGAKGKAPAMDERVPVRVVALSSGAISSYLVASSTVEAEHTADVYPEAGGLVVALKADETDTVKKGDVLVQLSEDALTLAEAKAKAHLTWCEGDLERVEGLYHDAVASIQEYEKAKYERRRAELEREEAKLRLAHAQVRAPIAGIVSKRMVRLGDLVATSTKLFSLVDTEHLIVKAALPGKEIRSVQKGQEAVITSDFLPDGKFAGRVRRTGPVVDPDTGTIEVLIDVVGERAGLKPGMFVDVRLIVDTHEDAVLVPKRAVVHDGDLRYVFVVKKEVPKKDKPKPDSKQEKPDEEEGESPPKEIDVARRVVLEAGYSDVDRVEARSGLAVGDTVGVVGQTGLKVGAKISIVERELPDGSIEKVEAEKRTDEEDEKTDGADEE